MPLLQLENINTGYGQFQVVYDLSLQVNENEIVSVIGPNGSGKSTILKTILGLLPVWKGEIIWDGTSLNDTSTNQRINQGITYSPQGNVVFDELTVQENLEIGGFLLAKDIFFRQQDQVLELFPILKKRFHQLAGTLSGGEQQMLALARALIPQPRILLLDEPSLGLSPQLIKASFKKLIQINKEQHITMIIVEQKVKEVLSISDRVYGVKLGRVAYEGDSKDLKKDQEELKTLFL